jgi:hypothetical protein
MKRLPLLLLLPFLTGCWQYQKNKLLEQEFRIGEAVLLPYTLKKVSVFDRRKDVASKDITIPTLSFKSKKETVAPPWTEEHTKFVKSELARYFQPKSRPVNVLVEVLEAKKTFETKWSGEREIVAMSLKVTLSEPGTNQAFLFGLGEAGPSVTSLDASEEYIAKLFLRAIEMSLYAAAKGIKHYEKL